MRDKLIQKLQQIQETLAKSGEVGFEKLEQLKAEMKRAFDAAIDTDLISKDFLEDLKKRRAQLGEWRISFFKSVYPIEWKKVLSIPFIYGMILPSLIFHLCLEIYHQAAFRLYGIVLVDMKEYFVFDRQLLPYLNWFEKFNCIYCSYVNNLLSYGVEIAGRTERYWCPIKYSRRIQNPHSQYGKFFDYLDAKNFREKWEGLRDFSDVEENKRNGAKIENASIDRF